MNQLIPIGYGNYINVGKITSIVKPEAAPVKRLIQGAKDNGSCVDATCGRKCKGVIITDDGRVVLTALLPETIVSRVNQSSIVSEHAPVPPERV